MLKKAFTCASLAVAVTGAAGGIAPAAIASDTSGGNYSQNVSLLPHACVDAKDINVIQLVNLEALNDTQGLQCNEGSKVLDSHKAPLSDVADIGTRQN